MVRVVLYINPGDIRIPTGLFPHSFVALNPDEYTVVRDPRISTSHPIATITDDGT